MGLQGGVLEGQIGLKDELLISLVLGGDDVSQLDCSLS